MLGTLWIWAGSFSHGQPPASPPWHYAITKVLLPRTVEGDESATAPGDLVGNKCIDYMYIMRCNQEKKIENIAANRFPLNGFISSFL